MRWGLTSRAWAAAGWKRANIRNHPNPGMRPEERQEVGLVTSATVVAIPVPSKLLSRKINDFFLFLIFFSFSVELSAPRTHSMLNHRETLNPSARCGQQFCPSSGRCTGATCQEESSCWGKPSLSASFLLQETRGLLDNPMALLLRIPGHFCDETALLTFGVCSKGKVRYCKGLTAISLSTIFRIPSRRIS